MFGLGFAEIIFIIIVAIIILGPQHMPRAARLIGQWMGKIRSTATSLNETIAKDDDLREIQQNLQSVRSELANAKADLFHPVNTIKETIHDTQSALNPDAVTANRAQPDPEPQPAAFFDKPLNWFPEEKKHSGIYTLPPPKFLPEEISRKVARLKISLPDPDADKANPLAQSAYSLNHPNPGRAFLRRIPLKSASSCTGSCKRIRLISGSRQ